MLKQAGCAVPRSAVRPIWPSPRELRACMPRNVRAASMLSNLKGMLSKQAERVGARSWEDGPQFRDNAPSWPELERLLEHRESSLGLAPQDLEQGPASALALKRTFGSSQPIRVKLYRDHAAWCPYCQKVWLLLEAKRIPYEVEKINMRCYGSKDPAFLAKVPRGLLPVLELDGQVITESDRILAVLESEFPEPPLMPPEGTPEHKRARQHLAHERVLFSSWMRWLTSSWDHEGCKASFVRDLRHLDNELGATEGPFCAGQEMTLPDIVYAPFLERMAASLAYYKGFHVVGTGAFPHVEAWFRGMEKSPTYLATRADYYSNCHDLPPQLGGCAMHSDGEPVAAVIDGRDGWRLPLPALSDTSLPEPYSPGEDPPADLTRAAARLIRNHAAVVRFSARGAGSPGARPVSAPLSDPSAQPDEGAMPHVDAALRHVAHALLVGVDDKQAGQARLEMGTATSSGCSVEAAQASLPYLRDRVGVPRDLPFPAARQMRAHLNWFVDTAVATTA